MIKHIMADELGVSVDNLSDGILLVDVPEMDSLTLPEIIIALEDAGYSVPEEDDIPRDCTVGDFIKIVEAKNAN